MSNRKERGFTLIELMAVVLIIGVLSSIAVPSYFKTMRVAKAQDAATYLAMVGNANRLFALDHAGNYAGSHRLTNACNVGACDGSYDACQLVRCSYLKAQNWDGLPFSLHVPNPASATDCASWLGASGGYVACASLGDGVPGDWSYSMNVNGSITAYNGAPPAP